MNDRRITLRELAEMLNSFPNAILDKEIGYLDLAHIILTDMEDLK